LTPIEDLKLRLGEVDARIAFARFYLATSEADQSSELRDKRGSAEQKLRRSVEDSVAILLTRRLDLAANLVSAQAHS